MKKVNEIDTEIRQLKNEREKAVVQDNNVQCAELIRGLYQSYIDVGFTEEQAWEILITQLKNNK